MVLECWVSQSGSKLNVQVLRLLETERKSAKPNRHHSLVRSISAPHFHGKSKVHKLRKYIFFEIAQKYLKNITLLI